jgi:hypothetical protein
MLKHFIVIILLTNVLYATEDLKEVVQDLNKDIDTKIEQLKEAHKEETSLLFKLTNSGFDSLSQTADVRKLYGLRYENFEGFINSLITKIKLPTDYEVKVKTDLLELTKKDSKDWDVYKYIYNKSTTSGAEYLCILAQNDISSKKVSFIYTQIATNFAVSEILVMQKVKFNEKNEVELSDIYLERQPVELSQADIEDVMTFFDIVAFKTFQRDINPKKAKFAPTLFFEPTTIMAIVGNADKVAGALKTVVETFRTTRSRTIKERLLGKGFDYFEAKSSIQIINGVKEERLNDYLRNLETRLRVPEDRVQDIRSVLSEVEYSDSSFWSTANILFSIGHQGNCKFASILYNRRDDGKYDFIVNDIDATFQLSPDVLIISKKLSVLGGLWQDEKEEVQKVPKSLTQDDIDTVMSFFNIIAFKGFMKRLGVDVDSMMEGKNKSLAFLE